jgi:hypothetical protein
MCADVGKVDAQQPSPSPSPAQSSGSSDEVTFGNYDIISSTEIGVRGLGIDGSRDKYYSDLNYRAGFRLFDASFLARAKNESGTLFDTLMVNSSGFDADPNGTIRINIQKTKWYKFDANYRRNSYDNVINCCNFAQALTTGAGAGRGQHTAHTKHTFADYDLKLLPQNRNIRYSIGYTMDRYRGPGTSTLNYARDDFRINMSPWSSRSDELRGGFEARVGELDLAFTQGYRWYRDDTVFSSGANPGNNLTNFTTLTSYLRAQPMRGQAWYSRISAHTMIEKQLDITLRYIFTKSNARFAMTERATGLGQLEGINVIIDLNSVTAASENIERPTHLFDLGFTWKINEKLRISDTVRFNSFNVKGEAAYSDVRFIRRTTGAPTLPYPLIYNLNPSRELEVRRVQNNLELDYDFGPRFSFFVGHRYINRQQEERATQRVYPVNSFTATGPNSQDFLNALRFTSESKAENTTNGFFGGFRARPFKSWTMYFDANRGQSDNAFTRVDNYDTLSFRLRNRITPRKGLNFNVSFVTRDNNNPGVADEALLGIPEFDVDISSRIFTSSVDWTPNEKFYFSAGYTFQNLTSDIGIIFNPAATGVAGLGRSQYYLRDHFFFFNASVQPHPRVTFFVSYRGHNDEGQGDRQTSDATGLFIRSYPLRYQAPEARLIIKLNKRLDWNVGYQYYDYKENFRGLFPDLFINQDYRAHLPYTSLRFYFGGGDR